MTPAEVAARHRETHVLCTGGCALMNGKDAPAPVIPCGGLCQGLRWEKIDRREGVTSIWHNPGPEPVPGW